MPGQDVASRSRPAHFPSVVGVRLPASVEQQLRAIADREYASVAQVARKLIIDGLRSGQSVNDADRGER